MVEINNQRKAFLDMLAWSEGTDNGRPKTRNHMVMTSLQAEILLITPITLAKHHAKPKTQINRRRTLPASFPLVDHRKQLGLKDFSPKIETYNAVIKGAWRYPMIDRGDIRQAIDRYSNIWASLPGAGYGQFEHKVSLVQNSKKRAERSEVHDV